MKKIKHTTNLMRILKSERKDLEKKIQQLDKAIEKIKKDKEKLMEVK